MNLDIAIFQFLNSWAQIPGLIGLVKLIVNEYFVPVGLSLSLLYLWISQAKGKKIVVLAASSVGLANLLIKLINLYFFRSRPFQEGSVNLAYYQPTDSGWPANSAAVAFAIATSIWLFDRKLGRWALLAAGVYGLTRVVVGVHYPSDILAGALIGVGVAYLLSRLKFALEWATNTLVRVLKIFGLEPVP